MLKWSIWWPLPLLSLKNLDNKNPTPGWLGSGLKGANSVRPDDDCRFLFIMKCGKKKLCSWKIYNIAEINIKQTRTPSCSSNTLPQQSKFKTSCKGCMELISENTKFFTYNCRFQLKHEQWNRPFIEPRVNRNFSCCRQVPFDTGTWSLADESATISSQTSPA